MLVQARWLLWQTAFAARRRRGWERREAGSVAYIVCLDVQKGIEDHDGVSTFGERRQPGGKEQVGSSFRSLLHRKLRRVRGLCDNESPGLARDMKMLWR